MANNEEINENETKLGLKAFYNAMETIGYESVIHKGKPMLHIGADKDNLMKELSLILDNTYITMLVLAIEDQPEKENLYLSRKFLEVMYEHLQFVTMDLMEKIINDERETKAHDNQTE